MKFLLSFGLLILISSMMSDVIMEDIHQHTASQDATVHMVMNHNAHCCSGDMQINCAQHLVINTIAYFSKKYHSSTNLFNSIPNDFYISFISKVPTSPPIA